MAARIGIERVGVITAMIAAALACAAPARAAALDPARQYRVRGEGVITIAGPHCCGGTRFAGTLQAAFEVRSSRHAALASLRFDLYDADVVVHDGFLGLFSHRVQLRCPSVALSGVARGWFDGIDRITFPAGALAVAGSSAEERLADGTCGDSTLELEATTDAPAALRYDPAGNWFEVNASFRATMAGDTYALTIQATGQFDNRPPAAVLALETPEVPQGNCPAYRRWDGQAWEDVAEANDPRGLVATPRSDAMDPDPPGGRGDVFNDRWYLTRDAGDRMLVGDGYRLPPATFEWGPVHHLELLALDHMGAAGVSSCRFRVVDTRAPVVTAPVPLTLGCTQPGGVSPATSGQLRQFLASGRATDQADASPTPLQVLTTTGPITDSTLFPADGVARPVRFRFEDDAHNVGWADSAVTVRDTVPPAVSLSLTPNALPPSHTFHPIAASITASDSCGGVVHMRLVTIRSNAPAYDGSDIVGAVFGTDDRGFHLYARPAPDGPRIYTVVYEGRDAAGNVKTVSAKVVVG